MAVPALLKVVLFSVLALWVAVGFCFYFFSVIEIFSYRLVIVFIALIFVSNFLASLLADYFANKKV